MFFLTTSSARQNSAVTLQKNNNRVIKISDTAAEDLKSIWDYSARHNEIAAGKLVTEIKNKFILLRDNPLIGREQYKYLVGLRSFVVQKYFIFYLPLDNGIDVLRVLHSSRDIEKIFKQFFDSLPDSM